MKALIAMSGGVDSSVAAALMMQKGYECIGATMKLFDKDSLSKNDEKACGSSKDVEDAKAVCDRLGIPHYVFDFSDMFKCRVMDNFVDCYLKGTTPNPCIVCNRYLKFEQLYIQAEKLGCDVIVTGHYARISRDDNTGRFLLKRAVDLNKDQSYVLYSLTQEQLSHTCFPLGEYTKEQIREMAEKLDFINAKKHDSQDICFIPDGNYKRFIEEHSETKCPPGDFVDEAGNVLGTHTGICNYTIGQRKGLGISAKAPLFVKTIDVPNNRVVLSDNESLFTNSLLADNFNWISVEGIKAGERLNAEGKVRYRHNPAAAVCESENGLVKVTFDEPQRAITLGQSVVLYNGDTVVGGGIIVKN